MFKRNLMGLALDIPLVFGLLLFPASAKADSITGFRDVSASQHLGNHVVWLKNTGITKGWKDGIFRPHQLVSREAMAAFMYRFAGSPAYHGSLSCFKEYDNPNIQTRPVDPTEKFRDVKASPVFAK